MSSAAPIVTPSVELLKDMRGSTGPGEGEITVSLEGARPHSTVGGYRPPVGGGGHD